MKGTSGRSTAAQTVVIPCFNQARFLPSAIMSVLEQRVEGDVECIVVDDGSTDATQEIAKLYGATLLVQSNRGLAAARNRGLASATGKYVVFLDADDRLSPGALAANADVLSGYPDAAFASGHSTLTGPDGTPLYTPFQYVFERGHYDALLAGSYIWNPGSVMFRTACLTAIEGFDPAVSAAADYGVYLRLASSWPVASHGRVTVEYRQHSEQMSHRPEEMLAAIEGILGRELERAPHHDVAREIVGRTLTSYQIYYSDPLVVAARSVFLERLARAESLPKDCDAEAHSRAYLELARWHQKMLDAFVVSRALALDAGAEREVLEHRSRDLWQELETAC
jgi:hypothetical protein